MNKSDKFKITSTKVSSNKATSNKISSNKADSNTDSKGKYLRLNQKNKDNYDRPEFTYTDKLSKEQVKSLLLDYELVNNIGELFAVPIGTHIRYFENKNGELKFRTGGVLSVNKGLPDYIVLSNGKVSWSVQVKPCIFYRRVTIEQIKQEFNKVILEKNGVIAGLQRLLIEQQNEIKEYKKTLKSLKK